MLLNLLNNASTSVANAHLAGNAIYIKYYKIDWLVDAGAANHMISNEQLLLDAVKG